MRNSAVYCLVFFVLSFVVACGSDGDDNECSSDTDCKGERVCTSGECVDPNGSGSNNPNRDGNGGGSGGNPDDGDSGGFNNDGGDFNNDGFGDFNNDFGDNNFGDANNDGGGNNQSQGGGDLGDSCSSDSECQSRLCAIRSTAVRGVCSVMCDDNFDCPINTNCTAESTSGPSLCYLK